jgi:alpha-L-glutamate ligase-like protein
MVMGINRRNALITRVNPQRAVRLVRDKHLTKLRLTEHGVPVPETIAVAETVDGLRDTWQRLGSSWVMKPCRSSQGRGVLIATGANGDGGWYSASGRRIDVASARAHAQAIIDGDHSDGKPDLVLIEPLLRPHPAMKPFSPVGLADIRVICLGTEPILAMARFPTLESGGRGNLHQGGIGAALDIPTGRISAGRRGKSPVTHHPDTGAALIEAFIPLWDDVLDAACRAGSACGLGYSGVDVVVDDAAGALVLEVNSHPGLEIQNVCAESLRHLVHTRDGGLAQLRRSAVDLTSLLSSRLRHEASPWRPFMFSRRQWQNQPVDRFATNSSSRHER